VAALPEGEGLDAAAGVLAPALGTAAALLAQGAVATNVLSLYRELGVLDRDGY
jgi:hypothetical protein